MMDPDVKPGRAALRSALLDAAEAVIARDGFGALRARGLTQAAGCALGALYTAFPDMDALMLAVKLRILDRLDARVAASLGGIAWASPRNPAPSYEEPKQGCVGQPTHPCLGGIAWVDPGHPASLPLGTERDLVGSPPQPRSGGASPGDDRLPLAMAGAYLDFAWDERRQWEVLFQHHLAAPQDLPDWYRERLGGVFARIAGPLAAALPGLTEAAAMRLAQGLFAAVHGIVVLGVEAKLGPASRGETAARVEMVVRAALAGLRSDPGLAEAAALGGSGG